MVWYRSAVPALADGYLSPAYHLRDSGIHITKIISNLVHIPLLIIAGHFMPLLTCSREEVVVVTRGLATTKFPSTNCEYALRFCVIFVYISYQLSSIIFGLRFKSYAKSNEQQHVIEAAACRPHICQDEVITQTSLCLCQSRSYPILPVGRGSPLCTVGRWDHAAVCIRLEVTGKYLLYGTSPRNSPGLLEK